MTFSLAFVLFYSSIFLAVLSLARRLSISEVRACVLSLLSFKLLICKIVLAQKTRPSEKYFCHGLCLLAPACKD